MKKILSILATQSTLASTVPTASACSVSQSFDLTTISVTGIEVEKIVDHKNINRLGINVSRAYNKIRSKIISGYNNLFTYPGKRLIYTDFIYGSAKDLTKPENNKKSWAIQIMDGYNDLMPISSSSRSRTLTPIFPQQPSKVETKSKVLLANNALAVKIYTTNANVKSSNSIAHIYLNKFVYSEANINNGNKIFNSKPNILPKATNLAKAIDISKIINLRVSAQQTTAQDIITGVKAITGSAQTNASKKIIDLLNTQLKDETKTLTNWNELTTTGEINFPTIPATDMIVYKMTGTSQPVEMRGSTYASVGDTIYVRLLDLGLANYIGNLNSYLYLQIATAR